MTFNTEFKSVSVGLPAILAAAKDKLFYQRRALGLNVQFIREDGQLDEFSFADQDRVAQFVAKLVRTGVDHVVSI